MAAASYGLYLGWWPRNAADGNNATSPAESVHSVATPANRPDLAILTEPSELVTVSTPRTLAQAAAERDLFDPRRDGWDSEAFVDRADGFWALVRDALAHRRKTDGDDAAAAFAKYVAPDFRGTVLRPKNLRSVAADGSLSVRRFDAADLPAEQVALAGLRTAIDSLAARFAGASDAHAHTKTTRVEAKDGHVSTAVIIEIAGHGTSRTIQSKLVCQCEWTDGGETPRLDALRLVDYEEADRVGPWFVDCTTAALAQNASYADQIMYGLNHWLARVERAHGIDVYGRHGMAVGDVNGDDREDFYLCQPGGLPNRLFVQNSDGSFADQSAAAGVDWLDRSSSALFVDLDNDGDQDLVIAAESGLLVMSNDSHGRFALQATLFPKDRDIQSLSAVDYDGDGYLDLYICTDFANSARLKDSPAPRFVYHDANDGGANVLYRNDIAAGNGGWRFTDVTVSVGLDADNRRHSLAAAWEDYDNDGDQDLYVANDYGQGCLYRNDRGRFTNIAQDAGVTDFGSGMSVAWGDVNRDGWMDLYVGKMFSSAGSRVTRQDAFRTGVDDATRAIYQRFAKGNSLFLGNANGKFTEVSADAGVEMARWAWSSVLADLNNDGRDDIFVANGYITGDNADDL